MLLCLPSIGSSHMHDSKLQSLVGLPGLLGVIDICFSISSFYDGFIWNWTLTFFVLSIGLPRSHDLTCIFDMVAQVGSSNLFSLFLYISFILPHFFISFATI
jgi:hypothetical protein